MDSNQSQSNETVNDLDELATNPEMNDEEDIQQENERVPAVMVEDEVEYVDTDSSSDQSMNFELVEQNEQLLEERLNENDNINASNAGRRYIFANSFNMQDFRRLFSLSQRQNRSSSPEPEQEIEDNIISFDTELAGQHLYLGKNMSRVSGVEYLDVGKVHRIMLFIHQYVFYPGEVLAFMVPNFIFDSTINLSNGFLFGVAFPSLRSKNNTQIYGATCQIYEKGTDERGHTLIKSRALQRFVTTPDTAIEHLEFITESPQCKTYGNVKILPEIYLPEPLSTIDMGSMNRFRGISAYEKYFTNYQTSTVSWPAHIYKNYNLNAIIEKVRPCLASHKIDTMPQDPITLSFWLARNLHISKEELKNIFITDSVNIRLKIISDAFKDGGMFFCRFCYNNIAKCSDLFAMSKHGVRSQYCNSAGYIHETNTVYRINPASVNYSGEPSCEFSWFPGYSWQIIVCKMCTRHIGWRFRAIDSNLTPSTFYGLSAANVGVSETTSTLPMNYELFRNLLRQHGMILDMDR